MVHTATTADVIVDGWFGGARVMLLCVGGVMLLCVVGGVLWLCVVVRVVCLCLSCWGLLSGGRLPSLPLDVAVCPHLP